MATPEQVAAEKAKMEAMRKAREAKATPTPAPESKPTPPPAATPAPAKATPTPAVESTYTSSGKPPAPPRPKKKPTPAEVLGFDPLAQAAALNRQLEQALPKPDPLAGIVDMPPKAEPKYTSSGYAGEGEAADVVIVNPEELATNEAARSPDLRLQARALIPEYNWNVGEDQAAKERIALLRERYEKNGMAPEAALQTARAQAEQEMSLLHTVGLWGTPVLGKPETVGQALLPQTTILGIGKDGQVVRAQESPVGYGARMLMLPGTGLAMAAQQTAEATGLTPESEKQPSPLDMLAEGQGFSDVAKRVTPPSSAAGRAALALGAAAADVFTPDTFTAVGGAAKLGKMAARSALEQGAMKVGGRSVAEARALAARAGLGTESEMLGARATRELEAARAKIANAPAGEKAKAARDAIEALPEGLRKEVETQLRGLTPIPFQSSSDYVRSAEDALAATGMDDAAMRAALDDTLSKKMMYSIEQARKGVGYAPEAEALAPLLDDAAPENLYRQHVRKGLTYTDRIQSALRTMSKPILGGDSVAEMARETGIAPSLQPFLRAGVNRANAALDAVKAAGIKSAAEAKAFLHTSGYAQEAGRALEQAFVHLDLSDMEAFRDLSVKVSVAMPLADTSLSKIVRSHFVSPGASLTGIENVIDDFVKAAVASGHTQEEAAQAVTAALAAFGIETDVMHGMRKLLEPSHVLDPVFLMKRKMAHSARSAQDVVATELSRSSVEYVPGIFTRQATGSPYRKLEALAATSENAKIFLPQEFRSKLGAPLLSALFKKKPETTMEALMATTLAFWSSSVTRGSITLKPGYFLNNALGNIEQVFVNLGVDVAIQHALKTELPLLLAPVLTGVGQRIAGAVGGTAGSVAAIASALAIGATKAGRALLRKALENSPLLSLGGIQGRVSQLLNATGEVVLNGVSHKCRDLYRIAAEHGVLDGFDTSMIREGLLDSLPTKATEALTGFANEVSQHIGTRQRMGLYALLMDMGMAPEAAAKATVEAMYDYGAVTKFERSLFTKLVSPFWRWQKNANRQFFGAMQNPASAYRMGVYLKGRMEMAELLDANGYGADYDEFGVGVGRMSPEEAARYQKLKPWLTDIRAKTRWSNEEINAWLRGYNLDNLEIMVGQRDPVSGVMVTQELVDALRDASTFAADMRWKGASWSTAPVRRPGSTPSKSPNMEDVFIVSLPPSGMEGAMQWMTGFAASAWTMGASVTDYATGGSNPAQLLEVISDNIVDVEKLPIAGNMLEGLQAEPVKMKLSDTLYQMWPNTALGLIEPPDTKMGTPAYVRAGGVAAAFEATGLARLNTILLDMERGKRPVGVLGALRAAGVSVSEYKPERKAGELGRGSARAVPGVDVVQELGEQGAEEP